MLGNRQAFLDTIAKSEIGPKLLASSDNGYNVLVGGTLFSGYQDHPREVVWLPKLKIYSTAAGRYQELEKNFDYYKELLNLPDFGPDSQDAIAIQQITEAHALPALDAGDINTAISRCAHLWASFPEAGYSQRENSMNNLVQMYTDSGGTMAAA